MILALGLVGCSARPPADPLTTDGLADQLEAALGPASQDVRPLNGEDIANLTAGSPLDVLADETYAAAIATGDGFVMYAFAMNPTHLPQAASAYVDERLRWRNPPVVQIDSAGSIDVSTTWMHVEVSRDCPEPCMDEIVVFATQRVLYIAQATDPEEVEDLAATELP
jgi:hypothetical protein